MNNTISNSAYGYKKAVNLPFSETLERTEAVLKENGFGVITKIDMQAKIKEKMGEEIGKYVILGACNPPLAFEALQVEEEVGLLLPCNVIVFEKDESVFVSAILPSVAMEISKNENLSPIALKVEEKLKKAVDSL